MDSMKSLLHQILPPSVAEKLSNKEEVPPEAFESVTIYFSGTIYDSIFQNKRIYFETPQVVFLSDSLGSFINTCLSL